MKWFRTNSSFMFYHLKQIFNSKYNFKYKSMNNSKDSKLEKQQATFLQWIKGENAGVVEEVISHSTEDDICWIIFKSGRRINQDLTYEYMIDVPSYEAEAYINQTENTETLQEVSKISKQIVKNSNDTNQNKQQNPVVELLKLQNVKLVNVKFKPPKKSLIKLLVSSFGIDATQNALIELAHIELTEAATQDELTAQIKEIIF